MILDDESAQESLQSVQKYASQSAKGTLESHVCTTISAVRAINVNTSIGSSEYALHDEYIFTTAALNRDSTQCPSSSCATFN